MGVSGIRTIMIGEKGEYGRRLVRYLEIHLPAATRVYHFTTVESFLLVKDVADIYLMEQDFFEKLPEERSVFLKKECKLILLAEQERADAFCKYHNPQELLEWLEKLSGEVRDLQESSEENEKGVRIQTRLTIVYSPVYDGQLKTIAQSLMKAGDLYIGAEDLGYKEAFSGERMNGDMGDLCYYIHLREEDILSRLQELLIKEEDIEVLYPPDMYFYLRELTKEDYLWFFDKVKKESHYRDVFWGAGNGFVADLDLLRCFDRIVLIDSRENERQNIFCDRLEKVMNIQFIDQERWKRIYREDVLYGDIWSERA